MLERRDKEITDLKRRVANMVVVGKISHVDHKNARYRIKSGNLVSDWIPDKQARAGKTRSYEGRDIGEQVIVISSSGDLSQGVIVGSLHTDANQAAEKAAFTERYTLMEPALNMMMNKTLMEFTSNPAESLS